MAPIKRAAVLAAVLVSAVLLRMDDGVDAAPSGSTDARVTSLRDFLAAQGSPAFVTDEREAELWKTVQTFYWNRGYQPAWIQDDALTPGGQAIVRTLSEANAEGLPAERYDPRLLVGQAPHVIPASLAGSGVDDRYAKLDVALTYAFLRYADDVASGTVDPRGSTQLWRAAPRTVDPDKLLEQAAGDSPLAALEGLRPAHPQYRALSEALVKHRRIASAGGWPALPATLTLKPGRKSPHVAALRERLQASGDFGGVGAGDVYDKPLVEAMKGFERRHGLVPDGIVDKDALAALNVPVEDRIRQIELNLERWRWQGWTPGARSILVNIPTFQLHGYEDGREVLTMRVVTGTGDNPTPVFGEQMRHVVFSPHWNVPPNILETEILPAVRRNPGYLARNNMEMFRNEGGQLAVRQRPGPRNSLGLVKFLFPNPFHVYLHDTPADNLFARSRRAFSHGCVRLEKPEELARFVLRGTAWTEDEIARAMRAGRERWVNLEQTIPVTIAYFTTWVDADGTVRFGPDVYRHDVAQQDLLPVPAPVVMAAAAQS
jgi:murein L,D-transpeptidase YcbB/YkuD